MGQFMTLDEAKAKNLVKRGDILQIQRGILYKHAVLFDDYDNCYHVTDDDKDSGRSFGASTVGIKAYIRRHPLEHILKSDKNNPDGSQKLDLFRVNNDEKRAKKLGINLSQVNSRENLDAVFAWLRRLVLQRDKNGNEIPVPYHLLKDNCENYAYEWKYGKRWTSPQTRTFYKSIISPISVLFGFIDFVGIALTPLVLNRK